MDLKQIEKLMAAMGRYGTKKLTIKKEGFELDLERGGNSVHSTYEPAAETFEEVHRAGEKPGFSFPKATEGVHKPSQQVVEDKPGNYVTSPMVGTFYTSPSPKDPAFIRVGDTVDKNTVVCIVEAMKVMNEIKAGVAGVVQEILVETGHPVEFGTKLFRVS